LTVKSFLTVFGTSPHIEVPIEPLPNGLSNFCLTFHLYALSDLLTGLVKIQFYPADDGEPILMWQQGKWNSDYWRAHSVSFSGLDKGRLRFESNMPSFSLSSLSIHSGACKHNTLCTFEPGERCFLVAQQQSPSTEIVTGAKRTNDWLPGIDTTTRTPIGHYLILKPTAKSPVVWSTPMLNSGSEYCLHFYVHKPTELVDEVIVNLEMADQFNKIEDENVGFDPVKGEPIRVWSSRQVFADDGLQWHQIRVDLKPVEAAQATIVMLPTTNGKYPTALDDIELRPGACVITHQCHFMQSDCGLEFDPKRADDAIHHLEHKQDQNSWLVGTGRVLNPAKMPGIEHFLTDKIQSKSIIYVDFSSTISSADQTPKLTSYSVASASNQPVYGACFTFSFIGFDRQKSGLQLALLIQTNLQSDILWQSNVDDLNGEWQTRAITITSMEQWRFIFVASSTEDATHAPFIAIADYTLDPEEYCHLDHFGLDLDDESLDISCPFSFDFCDWQQTNDAKLVLFSHFEHYSRIHSDTLTCE
jgi:hypothetical protein